MNEQVFALASARTISAKVMCLFEIPVFKYISTLWTDRGYSLVAVLGFSELVPQHNLSMAVRQVAGWSLGREHVL